MAKTIKAPKHPSRVRRDKARSDLATAKTNASDAKSIPALRDEVLRLASVVESILDRLDGSSE